MDNNDSPIINEDTLVQFDILTQIEDLLRLAGIDFWLRGGWAIDFLFGHITRSHSDIDLVAWKHDATQLRSLFQYSDFLFARDTGVQFDFSKSDQEISVIFIAHNGDDLYVVNVPEWIWLPDALSLPPQQIDGLACNVILPEQLLANKEGYQRGTGRPPRSKDLQSIEILRQCISTRITAN